MGIEKTRLILKSGQKINRNILCKICEQVMIDPQYCHACLNLFCKNCLQDFHKQDNFQNCICQNGENQIDQAPKLITYVLSQQIFSCKNKILGCKQQINYDDLDNHEENCKYKLTSCNNPECSLMIPKNAKQKHQQECHYKQVACKFCKKHMFQGQLEEHKKNCVFRDVYCEWCNQKLKAFRLKEHLQICPKVQYQCEGCTQFFNTEKFQKHDIIICLKQQLMQESAEQDQRGINLIKKCKILEQQLDGFYKCLISCQQCNKKCCESDLEKCEICKKVFCINCQDQNIVRCSTCHFHICSYCKDSGKMSTQCKNHNSIEIKREIYTL